MSNIVEFVGSIDRIRFQANDSPFKIATMRISEVLKGELKKNQYGDVIFKGEMTMVPSDNYVIRGALVDDKKYGPQYNFLFSRRNNPIEKMGIADFRRFLNTLSPKWGTKINKEYNDPRPIFENQDYDALTKIKGIGVHIAQLLFEKYEGQKDYSSAYVEFGKWGFNTRTTRQLVRHCKSVEDAINILKKNPYEFMGVYGIGFKTIDKKALEYGMAENDPRRVRAFVTDYFEKCAMEGSSWVGPEQLKKYLIKEIYQCDISSTFKWINSSDQFVITEIEGQKRIALKKFYEQERVSVKHLKRLMSFEPKELQNVEKTIKEIETSQGFTYSEEQIDGIHKMLDNQVSVLRGPGGVGKTSCLNAVIKTLLANNYSIATCALSGKAADNLRQITGHKGQTIHRLLCIDERGAVFNEKNPLSFDVVILDELSMVNIGLFAQLVAAIKDGARFIMVGDSAQLDAIGIGVMKGIVGSEAIPVITLRKIHRQAQNSAIITHSLTYRTGKLPNISEKDSWHRLGANKDLGYVLEPSNKEAKIMTDTYMVYKQMLRKYKVSEIQMLTPMTSNCFILNNRVQAIANPRSSGKEEYEIFPGKEYGYVLREGDRVLNTANNYQTISADKENEIQPIFNGNTGVIEHISVTRDSKGKAEKVSMVINFDGVGKVRVDEKSVRSIQLGYAMTVHKSQGSTIPCVIIALPYQYMLNSRELLYTALTRASKECYLLTSMRTLKATVKKTNAVVSKNNLEEMLRG